MRERVWPEEDSGLGPKLDSPLIGVRPVFITQGINEMQTFANSGKKKLVMKQVELNRTATLLLAKYANSLRNAIFRNRGAHREERHQHTIFDTTPRVAVALSGGCIHGVGSIRGDPGYSSA